jgi:hypothetical protein
MNLGLGPALRGIEILDLLTSVFSVPSVAKMLYLNEVRALRAMTIRWISEVPAEAIRISASR